MTAGIRPLHREAMALRVLGVAQQVFARAPDPVIVTRSFMFRQYDELPYGPLVFVYVEPVWIVPAVFILLFQYLRDGAFIHYCLPGTPQFPVVFALVNAEPTGHVHLSCRDPSVRRRLFAVGLPAAIPSSKTSETLSELPRGRRTRS
jgi:hypothetical protein